MKIHSLDIINFMAIGTAKVKLADRGLVLIQGENADETSATSNGAGKSSIGDAISWVNYGSTARGEEGDKVVNRFGAGGCRVVEIVEDNGDFYEISRHRKHKVGKNALWVKKIDPATGAVLADLTKGTDKLTQEVVNQILGCSYEVFVGAIYAGQEKMPDLPGMTDKNLKMLIEEASGATILEAAYREANLRLQACKSALTDASATVVAARNAVADANTSIATYEKNKTDFETSRIESVKKLHAASLTLKAELDRLTAQVAAEDPAEIKAEIAEYDAKIAAVAGEHKALAAANAAVVAKQREVDAAHRDVTLLTNATIRGLEAEKRSLDHQVGCPCSTCNRPFSAEDIGPAKEIVEKKLADAKEQLRVASTQHGTLFAQLEKLADARDRVAASMTDVSATNASRNIAQARLDAVNNILARIEALKSEIRANVNVIKAKKVEVNPFDAMIASAKHSLMTRTNIWREAEKTEQEAIASLKLHELAAKVYSPSGVRSFLLDEVTPFLNDQTAKYLGTLSDGNITATWTTLIKNAKGELREKFSIEVTNANGGDTFGLISGGEKRKVRIACALALQDLVARRASKPIELFIGDEIDDALDPAGLERLTVILEEKARERGSVFIISHNDLKDWVRNSILVRRSGKISTVTEVVS